MGLDVGPATEAAFLEPLQRAKTIVWNGWGNHYSAKIVKINSRQNQVN
jgi:hypothetical protein